MQRSRPPRGTDSQSAATRVVRTPGSTDADVKSELASRRDRLIAQFKQQKVDAVLVTALPNVRYLAGFTGSNAALLLNQDRAILFTDPRYQIQGPLESDCDVKVAKGPLLQEVINSLKRLKIHRVGFERNRASFEAFEYLQREGAGIKLVPLSGIVERLRMVKSPVEIATIKTSVDLNSAALEQALGQFRREMPELDLAAEIEYRMKQLGADGPSFETIVASGPRTALPHARPTAAAIGSDQLLLIDMGALVSGYASDMTRTFAVGRFTPRAKRIYRAVLESQLAAIDSVKPGVPASTVDRAARSVLRRHGLEKMFIHSTGHGLGLEIHEGPRVGRKEPIRLEAGMAITIEPGVYVEGFGGVRIEDTVVVTDTGCQVLTPTKKDLVVL
jgi:Xaa-Pro aminopeptidase